MARVVYSSDALRDLDEIGDYIAERLKNPTAALNTLTTIQDKIGRLASFPFMGTLLSNVYDDVDVGDYRFLVCANYLAFYRVEDDIAHIDRIIYSRRDYVAVIFGELPQDGIK